MSRSATTVARSPQPADAHEPGRPSEFPREERERVLREWEERAERAEASERRGRMPAERRPEPAYHAEIDAGAVLDAVPAPEPPAPARADQWGYVMQPPPRRGASGRHTVTITGHGAEGYVDRRGIQASTAQRHQTIKRHERAGFRPDRVAMWAVMLGVVLMLAAAASSHAAVLAHQALAHHLLAH